MNNIRRRRLVRGVGMNDVEGSPYTRDSESKILNTCPFYAKWCSLLNRVYVYSQTDRGKAYEGCSVCEDWLKFSKFKKWMVNQDWKGKEIDKDILGDGKIYSPDTCIFILPITNKFLINKTQYLGKYLQGVYFSEKENKYKGQYSDPFLKKRFVKSFDSEIDAHIFYLESKIQIADKIVDLEDDPRVKTYLYNFFRDKLKEVNNIKRYSKGDKILVTNVTKKNKFKITCPQDKMCSAMLKRYCVIVLEKCEATDTLHFEKVG